MPRKEKHGPIERSFAGVVIYDIENDFDSVFVEFFDQAAEFIESAVHLSDVQ